MFIKLVPTVCLSTQNIQNSWAQALCLCLIWFDFMICLVWGKNKYINKRTGSRLHLPSSSGNKSNEAICSKLHQSTEQAHWMMCIAITGEVWESECTELKKDTADSKVNYWTVLHSGLKLLKLLYLYSQKRQLDQHEISLKVMKQRYNEYVIFYCPTAYREVWTLIRHHDTENIR